MTHEELENAFCQLPADLQTVYRNLIEAIRGLARESARLQCRTSGKAFMLYAVDPKREKVGRSKLMGLFEVAPHQRRIAKGLANWKSLGLTAELATALKDLKAPCDEHDGEATVSLLTKCLSAVGCGK